MNVNNRLLSPNFFWWIGIGKVLLDSHYILESVLLQISGSFHKLNLPYSAKKQATFFFVAKFHVVLSIQPVQVLWYTSGTSQQFEVAFII